MSAYRRENPPLSYIPSDLRNDAGITAPSESPFVELSLLLPNWQLDALETAARDSGLTTAQMLRRVLGGYLTQPAVVAASPAG